MNLVPLNKLFEVSYGSKFDLKRMTVNKNSNVAFVGRTAKNNGVTAFVDEVERSPFPVGTITVNLGGAILESYVQLFPFYTAQNVAVLKARGHMSELEKLYYCLAIKANKFRYGAFGREANRTLRTLLVPEKVPQKFLDIRVKQLSNNPVSDKKYSFSSQTWKWFLVSDLFDVFGTKTTPKRKLEEIGIGKFPYVTTQSTNNGVEGFYNFYTEVGNVMVIDSAVAGFCSYQSENFSASDHVEKLTPKFKLNKYIGLFLQTIMNLEQFRYSYGKKFNQIKIRATKIKLPIDKNGSPDWQFMEDYIKSLPYSGSL